MPVLLRPPLEGAFLPEGTKGCYWPAARAANTKDADSREPRRAAGSRESSQDHRESSRGLLEVLAACGKEDGSHGRGDSTVNAKSYTVPTQDFCTN
ncbi:hypothetical protein H920_05413 [Fukomys damarensis]|uniref:Uncharacterized protein n=1 Tax=Fukomys damarensis TaxID=885580 RepID=A0A091DSL0_FUKDA|nr:hypothetical protein H920_05413 [Fukomys damarensis]